MNKKEFEVMLNKHRFEVLNGHDILIVADHVKKTIKHYKLVDEEIDIDTHDKIENAYLTNGWRHLKQLEDSLE